MATATKKSVVKKRIAVEPAKVSVMKTAAIKKITVLYLGQIQSNQLFYKN